MLTARGWALLGGSAAAAVAGRLLELVELLMVAAGAFALVALAMVYVRLVPVRLDAQRRFRPPRLHAGDFGRVELVVRNAGRRRSPLLMVSDPFEHGRRVARFALVPLRPGETGTAAYRAPTERRGVFALGPLELRLLDPFGLASHSVPGCPESRLTVYPHVEPIEPPPADQGELVLSSSGRRPTLAVTGEDFYALREYELGDDLRRVHWKSTAKRDNLMIRQEEVARQGRVTVVLDLRADVHSPATVEAAVSAAASVVQACVASQSTVRLLCSDGTDSGYGAGAAHLEAIMDHLAGAGPGVGPPTDVLLAALAREGVAGAVTLVTTGAVAPDELTTGTRLRNLTAVTVVLVGTSPPGPSVLVRGARLMAVAEGQPLAPAWAGIWPVRR